MESHDRLLALTLAMALVGMTGVSSASDNSTIATNGTGAANPTYSIDTGSSNSSEPKATNETVYTPLVVIKDAQDVACLLATINATIRISYTVAEGMISQTYVATSHLNLPSDISTHGTCTSNSSMLTLSWDNDTIQFDMVFTQTPKGDNWTLSSISVLYNLSDPTLFPGANGADIRTVSSPVDMRLFSTPLGQTKVCGHDVTVYLGSGERKVDVIFHDVRLAAFNLTSSQFPTEVSPCSEKDNTRPEDDILVPLIVACCLSLIVIIVVVAYAISRKVQEAREQAQYKPMP